MKQTSAASTGWPSKNDMPPPNSGASVLSSLPLSVLATPTEASRKGEISCARGGVMTAPTVRPGAGGGDAGTRIVKLQAQGAEAQREAPVAQEKGELLELRGLVDAPSFHGNGQLVAELLGTDRARRRHALATKRRWFFSYATLTGF